MIPSSHRVIVAEATPTSCVSYHILGEGSAPFSRKVAEESGVMLLIHHYSQCPYSLSTIIIGPASSCGGEEKMTSSSPLINYHDHYTVDLCPPFDVVVDGKTFAALRQSQPQEFKRVSELIACISSHDVILLWPAAGERNCVC